MAETCGFPASSQPEADIYNSTISERLGFNSHKPGTTTTTSCQLQYRNGVLNGNNNLLLRNGTNKLNGQSTNIDNGNCTNNRLNYFEDSTKTSSSTCTNTNYTSVNYLKSSNGTVISESNNCVTKVLKSVTSTVTTSTSVISNGSNNHLDKSNTTKPLPLSGKINATDWKPPPVSNSERLSLIVIYFYLTTMAAIGIVSAQDWLAFLIISAQLGAIALIILAIINYRGFYIVYKTVFRDIKGGYRYLKLLICVRYAQRSNATVQSLFAKNVKKHPKRVCFYFEDEKWTFQQVDDFSNKIANYFTSQGLKKGDSVALFMENRPEYVCMWLGLCKIGVIPALINFNLRLQPLKHSIQVANSSAVIYGHELSSAVKEVLDLGGMDELPLYCSGHKGEEMLPRAIDLDSALKIASTDEPTPSEPIKFTDKLVYIYTSGTTGLPKAAVIKHSRFIFAVMGCYVMSGFYSSDVLYAPLPLFLFFTMGIHYFIGVSDDEIIYDPLPLYHTAGGMIGVGQALVHGCSTVIRKRFSASAYWQDCARYRCTAAQYIGEICRYLLLSQKSPYENQHCVRLMFGNGLRPQIWTEFVKRFNVKIISEFYGATEGNCNIININNKVGAVGFISRIAPFVYPVTLIKVDEATGEPVRDPRTGLVWRCRPNEEGELVGRIVENHPVREFQGYADSTSTTKKIVRNVFRKGDAAFRTGDILVMDEFGYFYFKDRTGDTFRWKGENVSTSEVEAVVSNVCGLKDAVVYGVEVPESEGRAGMAAILDPDETLDFDAFTQRIAKALPPYARPVFIRIIKQMDMTGTYKMKKLDLQKEGFDITCVTDKIYVFNSGKYIRLTNEIYSNLTAGKLRL